MLYKNTKMLSCIRIMKLMNIFANLKLCICKMEHQKND